MIEPSEHSSRVERLRLSLDGLSVGDAFGERFFGPPSMMRTLIAERELPQPPWHYTDDTELALGIADVLLSEGHLVQDALADVFASRYRENPDRGYGGMAHRILQALGEGVDWREIAGAAFGGEGSMGNGGAMRVAPVGAYFADDLDRVAEEARASAEITHMHPEGQAGAVAAAVAAAIAWQMQGQPHSEARERLWRTVLDKTPAGATRTGIEEASRLSPEAAVSEAVDRLGNGSGVIAPDTVPFTLWCAARHLGNYEEALWTTVSGLGDRDTTCAIVGGIVALSCGPAGIPREWLACREPLEITW